MKCPSCGSENTDPDFLVVEDKEYPCVYCNECQWVFRREENKNE